MLRIAKMEILGFKSFGDRTEVEFPTGVTAIVGPNGCGKSNIGDAINWVLGEQSPRILRGRQMADVIFGGSAARKPLGLAEVSIHMTGSRGLKHSENGEVVLTRRLFRSGDSEYLLNGKKTRLKDIQERYMEGVAEVSPTAMMLPPDGLCFRTAVSRFENDLINQALQRTHGNKNKAADLLKLNRTTLVEKIKRRNLVVEKS